jgi:hypothetical protein
LVAGFLKVETADCMKRGGKQRQLLRTLEGRGRLYLRGVSELRALLVEIGL